MKLYRITVLLLVSTLVIGTLLNHAGQGRQADEARELWDNVKGVRDYGWIETRWEEMQRLSAPDAAELAAHIETASKAYIIQLTDAIGDDSRFQNDDPVQFELMKQSVEIMRLECSLRVRDLKLGGGRLIRFPSIPVGVFGQPGAIVYLLSASRDDSTEYLITRVTGHDAKALSALYEYRARLQDQISGV